MKIAISSTGKKLSDNIAELFGRCSYFIIAEIENGKITKTEILKNESNNRMSGAGMAAAKLLAEKDVNALIAKSVGPRAADVLKQFNIKIYNGEGIIEDVLQKIIDKLA